MTEFRTQDLSLDLPAFEFLLFETLISSLTFLSLFVGKIGRSSISLILLQTFKHVNVYYYYAACTQNIQKWGRLLWVGRVRKNTVAKEKKLHHEASSLFQRSREWSWSVGKKIYSCCHRSQGGCLRSKGENRQRSQAPWFPGHQVETPGGRKKKNPRWEEIQQPDSNWKLRVGGSGVRVGNICSVYSLIQQKMSGWIIFSAP